MADIITCLCLISNLYPVVISHTSGDNMTLILCFWSGRLLPLTPVPSLAFHYSPPALCPPLCLQISLLWTLASTPQPAPSKAWPSAEVRPRRPARPEALITMMRTDPNTAQSSTQVVMLKHYKSIYTQYQQYLYQLINIISSPHCPMARSSKRVIHCSSAVLYLCYD